MSVCAHAIVSGILTDKDQSPKLASRPTGRVMSAPPSSQPVCLTNCFLSLLHISQALGPGGRSSWSTTCVSPSAEPWSKHQPRCPHFIQWKWTTVHWARVGAGGPHRPLPVGQALHTVSTVHWRWGRRPRTPHPGVPAPPALRECSGPGRAHNGVRSTPP